MKKWSGSDVGLMWPHYPTLIAPLHSSLINMTHVPTKVHVILRRYVVLTRMYDNRELACDIIE